MTTFRFEPPRIPRHFATHQPARSAARAFSCPVDNRRHSVTNEARLVEVQAMLATCNASITKLLGKTNQSVSFGDQTYTLTDVEKLMRIRDKLRQEERSLESILSGGTKRRTIKINFPSC